MYKVLAIYKIQISFTAKFTKDYIYHQNLTCIISARLIHGHRDIHHTNKTSSSTVPIEENKKTFDVVDTL